MDRMALNIIAVIASFFICGLGQFLKGHFLRGIVLFVAMIVCAFLMLLLIGFLLVPLLWLFNMYDAWTLKPRKIEGEN